jgi:3-hydroxybutyryl-CoA dehydratase
MLLSHFINNSPVLMYSLIIYNLAIKDEKSFVNKNQKKEEMYMSRHDSFVRECPYEEIQIGDTFSITKGISQADVVNYAGIIGDFNPIHVNPEYAANSRFGKNLCHGMLTASFISTCLGCGIPGNNALYLSQEVKFVKPVYFGDVITCTVEVKEKIDGKQLVKLDTIIKNQNGEFVVKLSLMEKPLSW